MENVNKRIDKAIKTIQDQIAKYGAAELYCHPLSLTPLNDREKALVFDNYRHRGYNIHTKINRHGITYYRIA